MSGSPGSTAGSGTGACASRSSPAWQMLVLRPECNAARIGGRGMAGKSPVTATDDQSIALKVMAGGADRAEADRARAILLLTLSGWTSARIAEAFGVRRIHERRARRTPFTPRWATAPLRDRHRKKMPSCPARSGPAASFGARMIPTWARGAREPIPRPLSAERQQYGASPWAIASTPIPARSLKIQRENSGPPFAPGQTSTIYSCIPIPDPCNGDSWAIPQRARESDSTWRTKEVRHVGSDTVA